MRTPIRRLPAIREPFSGAGVDGRNASSAPVANFVGVA
jgi:hypothetical protein